jgi:hypothetical protein
MKSIGPSGTIGDAPSVVLPDRRFMIGNIAIPEPRLPLPQHVDFWRQVMVR